MQGLEQKHNVKINLVIRSATDQTKKAFFGQDGGLARRSLAVSAADEGHHTNGPASYIPA